MFSEEGERTTDEVVQWLILNGKKFLRINREDEVRIVNVSFVRPRLFKEINKTCSAVGCAAVVPPFGSGCA